jgi:hypothetical protein
LPPIPLLPAQQRRAARPKAERAEANAPSKQRAVRLYRAER